MAIFSAIWVTLGGFYHSLLVLPDTLYMYSPNEIIYELLQRLENFVYIPLKASNKWSSAMVFLFSKLQYFNDSLADCHLLLFQLRV